MLSSAADIHDYLSYTIKVLELSRKFSWESVLKYDDEYRVLQHTYGYPWSFDHSHHEVMLVPHWVSSGHAVTNFSPVKNNSYRNNQSSANPPTGTHNSSGQEICRNFNRAKGCQKTDCGFSHSCNGKVGNQVCGKLHPGHAHGSGDK